MSEAVELVLLTSSAAIGGGIFIPQSGAPVRILDMARQLVSDSQSKSGREIADYIHWVAPWRQDVGGIPLRQ